MFQILKQTDPFKILNISTPTTDKKEIKHAFRRMAVKYHPDVMSFQNDKNLANEVFAKINGAYEDLGGKDGCSITNKKNGHEDMCEIDDESFVKLFTDLVASIEAGGAAGSNGSILRYLIEFLESNVDGFSENYYSDPTLEKLLKTGSVSDIKNEMEDTSALLQLLHSKNEELKKEMAAVLSIDDTGCYWKSLEKEELLEEIYARKGILEKYIEKATKRFTRLQLTTSFYSIIRYCM